MDPKRSFIESLKKRYYIKHRNFATGVDAGIRGTYKIWGFRWDIGIVLSFSLALS